MPPTFITGLRSSGNVSGHTSMAALSLQQREQQRSSDRDHMALNAYTMYSDPLQSLPTLVVAHSLELLCSISLCQFRAC